MNAVIPPAEEDGAVDRWGNLRGDPQRVIDERHGDYFIKVMIYRYRDFFYYGYQLKVGTMIRQRAANVSGQVFKTPETARMAASLEIEKACAENKNVRKLFADFTMIRYSQGSLFGDE
jgi:hypothetical protein